MRTAELETVVYRTDEIQCASNDLLVGYARYSGNEGTVLLPDVGLAVNKIISEQLSDRVIWNTPGLTFNFSGFPPPLQHMKNGKLEISAQAPFFTIEEGYDPDLNPNLREYLKTIVNALVEDLHYKHRVEVEKEDPLLIVRFPKDIFAQEIRVDSAIVLD